MVVLSDEEAFRASNSLHPKELADAEEDEIESMRSIHQARIEALLVNHIEWNAEEVIRLLLALQHNGFASGLYTRLSIFNHSCKPNVIKFDTKTNTAGASECWTIRAVKAGEELCIHYCAPGDTTVKKTQNYLLEQHRFKCGCQVTPSH